MSKEDLLPVLAFGLVLIGVLAAYYAFVRENQSDDDDPFK